MRSLSKFSAGRRRLVATLVPAALVALLAACGGAPSGDASGQAATATDQAAATTDAAETPTQTAADAEPVTVAMGIIPTYYTFMPHFVAEGLGLFERLEEEHGITLEMVSFSSGADETRALVSGQLQMASSMFTEAAIPMSKGEPLVLAMVYWNGGVSSMLVSEQYQAETLPDLREELGRPIRVGVTGFGSGTHVAALAQLNNLGVAADDYEIVPVGGIQAYFPSLAEGKVDVVQAGEPATQNLINEGFGRVIVNGWDPDVVEEVFGEFQANGLHVRREFMEQRPDAVQHVVDALAEAMDFIQENIDDPSEILAVLPTDAQESLADVHDDVFARVHGVLSTDGCPREAAARAVDESLRAADLIGKTVEIDWTRYQTDRFLPSCS